MSIFQYKTYDIHYIVDGDLNSGKEIIVLLNGIMMSTLSWEIFKDSFTENTVLIRYDMLDQGKSSIVDFQYTQEIQVEILKELLEHLKLNQVHIVGISYGASVALQFAAKYQKYIKTLVVANVVAKTSPWLKAIGDGWCQVGRTRDGEAYYNITIPYIYSPQFYTKQLQWMENRKKILIPVFSNPTFLDAMERLTVSAETHDVVDSLDNITVDTLIISSKEDYLTPVYEQQFIDRKLPNSKMVLIEECGHASMYEVPELFASLVLGHVLQTKKISI
jgi:pimeloyl-ACP methyl ester carboxylesterase